MQQFDYNKYLQNNPLLKESFIGPDTDVYEEAQNILDDILSERDWMEIQDMTFEDALDTVEAYGHIGPKARAIATKLVSLVQDTTPTRQMTGDPDTDFMGEAIGQDNDYKKAALEIVALAKNIIKSAEEQLSMRKEISYASRLTNADQLSDLYYHLLDELGDFVPKGMDPFRKGAKKIIVDKYNIEMTDEYGRKMTWR